jgi:hypothetical protein
MRANEYVCVIVYLYWTDVKNPYYVTVVGI